LLLKETIGVIINATISIIEIALKCIDSTFHARFSGVSSVFTFSHGREFTSPSTSGLSSIKPT